MQAYLLVQTESGRGGIAKDLRAVPGVILAEDLTGPYDAIALAGSDSIRRSLQEVVAAVWEVPGVTRTISAPLVRPAGELRDDEAA